MSDTIKTYNDSYLYTTKLKKFANDEDRNNQTIRDFIANSNRIDKASQAFAGIIEDIKRYQTSRVVYAVLMMDNVHLCINNYEMPRSFKVFDAKDYKNNKQNAVFIDCTGLIEYKNGFFICRKIDVLITYLYDAMVYLLYRRATTKMMNNSEVIISSTNCFVSLFTYVLDYLRIIGYAENKNKIAYLIGLYYLNHLMCKDVDSYTKNISAKIAGVELKSIPAYDLYLEAGMFDNINNFINVIANTFKLKGLNLEVFIGRWAYLLGAGTHYATELYTNFGVMLCSAYCGSYVVQQKQIEKVCGTNLVKYNNALRKIADSTFESYFPESIEYHDAETVALAEAAKIAHEGPKTKKSDFATIEEAVKLLDSYKAFYKDTHQEKLLPKEVVKLFTTGFSVLESYVANPETAYEEGALAACADAVKGLVFGNDELNKLANLINNKILICSEACSNQELSGEDRSRAARCLSELRTVKTNI